LNSKMIVVAVVVIVVAVSTVAYVFTAGKSGTQQAETQVWWIASDSHLGNMPADPVSSLQVAINDVNGLGIADHAAILGDILNNSANYSDNFFDMMGNLNVDQWYYILGNHDFQQSGNRAENFLPKLYYAFDVLGIRFIFISTEAAGTTSTSLGGVMGSEQFTWLQDELETHSNQPVFIFSHQPYSSWNVWDNLAPLIQSEGNVKAWFCGHLHQWVVNEDVTPYNFIYVCDNSLDWSTPHNYAGVFLFLQREGNTVNVTIKFRDHLDHEWISVPATLATGEGAMIDNVSFSVNVA
jgi:3',5'-cyclic AMP phosphodiesterase CpdA